ncbi:MAG: rhodanese-like domain-containing protein [Gammaproteobacteria bacterium]|nr:rhodanese-like domain-containing protein [Gammaproteobacteria bacterium]
MTKTDRLSQLCAVFALHIGIVSASGTEAKITPDPEGLTVDHQGVPVLVQRERNETQVIEPNFQRTSRRCPPFCIQPIHLPGGVETIGEIEMPDYLRRRVDGDDSVAIVDSRGAKWHKRGTIPGAVNIHHKRLSLRSAEEPDIADMLERQFDARRRTELWDFRDAKTLVMFCNEAWCGQSPINIRSRTRMGYPPSKIKWYLGGMQAWETLGLTTVVAESQ